MSDEKEVKDGGEETVTPAVEETVEVDEAKAAEVAAEEEKKNQEKKFTDADMKAARESFEFEAKKERERIALETENRVLRELAEGKKVSQKEPEKEVELTKPVRPVEADFETREAFNAAMDKYEDDRDAYRDAVKSRNEASKVAESKGKEIAKAVEESVIKQITEGRKEYKDFDKVVVNNSALVATPQMVAVIARRDNGHDIQYYLGSNPAESLRLAKLDPSDLAVEIGAISERLKAGKQKPPVKKQSGAPAPAATVSAKAKTSIDTTLEGKSQEERLRLLEERSRQNRASGAWQNGR